mmetsp:Transcript_34323/g.39094  ORF Transcript_34323/g.39094 Transcript_34323/m.39094 type:complete len:862 (+) Transcript_34323:293-2878(+)|eukprot:CAMPEP_0194143404 /NCGR_PEP_ID=MMETSP0152-20130528/12580_1 /TAXON_ID=1049557 /ORGANISM="Thalassiothrix antarctica, Strain L6-D1" /LENGTH=861 /DNA_ID=CAMNT_0038842801 /DNA_START=212 /DNA_END=2797 /DNA_ORIENTATION=-
MGNKQSVGETFPIGEEDEVERSRLKVKTFPGSAILDGTAMLCGVDTTGNGGTLIQQADRMCISSPPKEEVEAARREEIKKLQEKKNPTSALFARALVNEVTDNPKTMTPAKMAEREKKLLKAQDAAAKKKEGGKAIGAPGGIGQPSLLGSIAHALGTGNTTLSEEDIQSHRSSTSNKKSSVEPPSSIQENRAQVVFEKAIKTSKHRITVGLSLSRRHSMVGHPDTVTRQTAFDFNELQDREYKYVSSTDATGWQAGGGERGGTTVQPSPSPVGFDEESDYYQKSTKITLPQQLHKVAAPDTVHIPIIHIDAESAHAVDVIISALARGEVFIPHMTVLPEALSVNGISPPDLVVRFGCERSEESPPDEWPNWCLEFMHNQLYEYFHSMGARWMKRPFQITLAKKVRWKTVKHMNRYFAHAERVLDAWREKGPQLLDPQLSYIEGGATPEEVAKPHGLYLLRNGVPTNYFAPNFDPPYTTKMTRSLLTNVLDKSWDKKLREWTLEPVPRLLTPTSLLTNLCGCSEQGGFMANEVTTSVGATLQSTVVDSAITVDDDSHIEHEPPVVTSFVNQPHFKLPPIETMFDQNSPKQRSDYYKTLSSSEIGPQSPKRAALVAEKFRTETLSDVAASATTIPHINKFLQVSNMKSSPQSKSEVNSKKKKSKRNKYMAQEIAKAALEMQNDENSRSTIVDEAIRDPKKMELAQTVVNYEEKKIDNPRHMLETQPLVSPDNSSVPRIDSNMSLDYSLDSSLLGGGDSSITGNYFTAGDSVSTSASKRKGQAVAAAATAASKNSILPPEDSDVVDGSSLASGNSNIIEAIPSDEELFSIGWAKALDMKSGAYYYFTLDRSKIIWDNPLLLEKP